MKYIKEFESTREDNSKKYTKEDIEDYYLEMIDLGYKVEVFNQYKDDGKYVNNLHFRLTKKIPKKIRCTIFGDPSELSPEEFLPNKEGNWDIEHLKIMMEDKKKDEVDLSKILNTFYSCTKRVESMVGKVVIGQIDINRPSSIDIWVYIK